MSKHDTLLRTLALLRLIPRAPAKRDTSTLHELLREEGFIVDIRTLQRDLQNLSVKFPLTCEVTEKNAPHRWQYTAGFASDLPAMDTAEALFLAMAEQSLTSKLPPSALGHIRLRLARARQHLDSLETNDLAHWDKRVASIPEGKELIAPTVKPGIWESIADSLLNQHAIDVTYRSRFKKALKQYTVHPQGLVVRGAISYVLATIDEHEDIRQLALHRFQTVTPSAETFRPCPDFSIETYVQQGNFDYPVDSQPVELVADIYQDLAWKLEETPLSNDQQLSAPNGQGRVELRATVPNDKQTLWWIRGMGPAFLVRQPAEWRDALAADAAQVLAHAKTCGYQPAAENASS